MEIGDLPALPKVSVLSGPLVERAIITRIIQSTGRRGVTISQRQILGAFNRSNRKSVAGYLKRARDLGLIKKVDESTGIMPDTYARGRFFDSRTRDGDRLKRLSNAFWHPKKGILSNWPYPTAWGYGCVPEGAILGLATLIRLDEPVRQQTLAEYLSSQISPGTFSRSFRWMREHSLIMDSSQGVSLSGDWREKFESHLNSEYPCKERHEKGNHRRRRESELNRLRVSRSQLTDAERISLRRFPCVEKGCCRPALQVEHFPPKRYLLHLEDRTNRHFVWAICSTDNRASADFIKSLPPIEVEVGHFEWLRDDIDPLRVYDGLADIYMRRYRNSLKNRDAPQTVELIRRLLGAWETLGRNRELGLSQAQGRPRVRRVKVGSDAHFPGASRCH